MFSAKGSPGWVTAKWDGSRELKKEGTGRVGGGLDSERQGQAEPSRVRGRVSEGVKGFFTRLWKDGGNAGTGPGRGHDPGEAALQEARQWWAWEMNTKRLTGPPHVPEAWTLQGRQQVEPLQTHFSLQLPQLLPRCRGPGAGQPRLSTWESGGGS